MLKIITKILVIRLKPILPKIFILFKVPLLKEGPFRITSLLHMKFSTISKLKREGWMDHFKARYEKSL